MATKLDSLLKRTARSSHILDNCQRGVQGEINQLWQELDHLDQVIEGHVGFPEIDRLSVSTISAGAGATAVLVEGRNFIPTGWKRGMVNINPGVNMGIDWYAAQPGSDGNRLRIVYVKGGAGLGVAYNPANNTATVTLAAGGSTANAVIAAVQATAAVYAQVNGVLQYGHSGAGVINVAQASTAIVGGTGTALRCAALTVDPGGANNAVLYTARVPGTPGNSITVAYTVGVVGAAPVVTVTGQRISVAIDAGVTTANAVILAVNNHTTARGLVHASRVYGDTGAGTIPGLMAAAALTNGADGQGLRVEVGGLAGVLYNVTDTTFNFDVGALAEQVNTELTTLRVDICGHGFRIPMAVVA
jgi:hypothetical protein